MKKTKRNKLGLKEIVTLTIVITFLVSAPVGFLTGYLGYQLRLEAENADRLAQSRDAAPEESVVEAVKTASPAVVSVIVTKDLPVIEQYYESYDPFGNDEFLKEFFGSDFFAPFLVPQYRQNGTEKREIGGGTGFIVSSDGLILTNKHVVNDAEADYTVLTNSGEKIPATVLFRDPNNDIALIKIDKTGLPVIELGDSDKLEIGQAVVAIGNALGEFRNTVSVGVVSGLQRSIVAQSGPGQTEELSSVIQTDAAVNPGNSGGPLLNLSGKAIGVNVAIVEGAQNIGFALPINSVKEAIEQIRMGN